MSYLIKDTTKEERERIVKESLGNIEANCDGCMAGLAEMYEDYIDGKKELRDINMEFNARYVKGEDMEGRGTSCVMQAVVSIVVKKVKGQPFTFLMAGFVVLDFDTTVIKKVLIEYLYLPGQALIVLPAVKYYFSKSPPLWLPCPYL